MTLHEYLATLTARTGVPLMVRDDDLDEFDIDEITGPVYQRGAYCIVTGLSRVPAVQLHKRTGVLMTGALDVTLLQPVTKLGALPDASGMARLMAVIVRAPESVTEIADNYPLYGSLVLITESDPLPADVGDPLRGRIAVARYQYQIWR